MAATDYISDVNAPEIPYISLGARLNLPAEGVLGPDESFPNWAAGQIDDLGLWTRGLTGEEVAAIYAAGQARQALDIVVVAPSEIEVTIGRSGGKVTVGWSAGKLQSAPAVSGPWSDVTGTSPITKAASDESKFYRAER